MAPTTTKAAAKPPVPPSSKAVVPRQPFLRRLASSIRHRPPVGVTVQLLDDSERLNFTFNGNDTGKTVLDAVCSKLDIVERDFFGLRYHDAALHRYWLDLDKSLSKQFRSEIVSLSLRIRFYPKDPSLVKEHVTRYQVFVQLRRDLLHGRLHCTQHDSIQLAALIVQASLGDYDEATHQPGYISGYKLLIKQTERLEEQIAQAHRDLRGTTSSEAEKTFLALASRQPTYGLDPYIVKEKSGEDSAVGATSSGLLIITKNVISIQIPWENVEKVDFSDKELRIYPTRDFTDDNINELDTTNLTIASNGTNSSQKSAARTPTSIKTRKVYKLNCPSQEYAKHLWRHILSQQAFYTEDTATRVKTRFSKAKIPFLARGATFRMPSVRVNHELEVQTTPPREHEPEDFQRYPLPQQQPRSEISSVVSRNGTLRPPVTAKVASSDGYASDVTVTSEGTQNPSIGNTSVDTLTVGDNPRASTPLAEVTGANGGPQFVFTPDVTAVSLANATNVSTTSVKTTSDENLTVRSNYDQASSGYATSAPSPDASQVANNNEDETVVAPPPKAPEPQPQLEATEPVAPKAETPEVQDAGKIVPAKPGWGRRIVRSLLSASLVFILLGTLTVIVFEADEGKGIKLTREIPTIASFRQVVYDPTKDVFHQVVNRFSH